jgi:cysteine desulfurase family protein (TIGR01976 family)
MTLDVSRIREKFPGLARQVAGKPAVFFDGPAGTQVPRSVAEAVSHYLLHLNANHGGLFATSIESDAMLDLARQAGADLFGVHDPETIVFGANMTTMTFHFSRAIARTWSAGDEIIVSDSDHDANFSPWVIAAHDRGVRVHRIRVRPEDTTLDLDDLRSKLSSKTKLVAVGAASNASGTIHPLSKITELAHAFGALVYVDAVHYTPHGLVDAPAWGADFVVASAYKFFGPHAAMLWGRRDLLESLPADKVRPASNAIPDRWMTGTPAAENISGTLAAIEYLADLGRSLDSSVTSRRSALVACMKEVVKYEGELGRRLIAGVERRGYRVWGITDSARSSERVPTVSITHESHSPRDIAKRLAEDGIFVWHGNFYAQPLSESLGLEPAGMVRIGLVHYNTVEEVDRCVAALPE